MCECGDFPKIRGTVFRGPDDKDPTIKGTILGCPIFRNPHVDHIAFLTMTRNRRNSSTPIYHPIALLLS